MVHNLGALGFLDYDKVFRRFSTPDVGPSQSEQVAKLYIVCVCVCACACVCVCVLVCACACVCACVCISIHTLPL